MRLVRVNVDELSDEELTNAYYRAGAFAIRPAMRKFAEAVLARPSMSDASVRFHAYATMVRTEDDIAKALEYVEQGRRAAGAQKISCASWDLMELSLHLGGRDGDEVMRLVQHIERHHLNEPGVAEALTRMLIEVGLLRPDGSPAFQPEGPMSDMAEAAEPAEEPSSGLWTPDSGQPAAASGKLWTPE